jgi:prophage DNA circulation protein
MTWSERLKEASYTSPSGVRTTFQYEDVEESFDKNISIYRFPSRDGAYVLGLGSGEKHYPFTAFLSGTNYDLRATVFINALYESGNGILEHPMYGTKTVQVTRVIRKDALVTAANQARIEIEFVESTDKTFPATNADVANDLLRQQEEFDELDAQDYADKEKYNTPQERVDSESRWTALLKIITAALTKVAQIEQGINAQFHNIYNQINSNITTLIDDPLSLVMQTITLVKTPSRMTQQIERRLSGYADLTQRIIDNAKINDKTNDTRNSVIENSAVLAAVAAAAAQATLFAEYKTKSEALKASQTALAMYEQTRNYIETSQQQFQIDDLNLMLYGDQTVAERLNNIAQQTSSRLAGLAFTLKQERNVILQRERTIIDLSFELYGSSSDAILDELISINQLEDEEIILIPKNRNIVYYA